MNTYRVLAAVLSYPSEDLAADVNEMTAILDQEGILGPGDRQALSPLLADLQQMDIYDLQARYGELFDQSRSLSLNLFEHIHGESLDRGQAMVDLQERYRARGLEPSSTELPDHLPVFLEYLSELPAEEARSELAEARAVIAALAKRLRRRATPYAAVLEALAHLAEEAAPSADLAELTQETPESDPPTVDAQWQEEPVDFSRKEKGFVRRQRARAQGAAFRGHP
ncbi:MAG TPA: nitrate reductase molybdenum cofactor assembly chaperone [Spirochaetia bacterium]|nr:nitrate reductase molybdenum cofactor assembly chaperone [Spirochaetia bacterium]